METDEELETGYGSGVPPGDNLCNDYVQGLAASFAALGRARGDRVEEDEVVLAADSGTGSLFGNAVVLRQPVAPAAWPALADRLHAVYAGRPGGSFLLFSAWPTPDLSGAGFGRVGHPPLMFRPAGPVAHEPVEGLELVEVADAPTALDWERTLVHGYPEPGLQPYVPGCFLPERALAAPGWRHWVAYLDGEPVATSSAYVAPHHGRVDLISTVEAARGRGVGRAVTVAATLAAPELPAMLISSDLGRNVYDRLGYLPLCRFSLWEGHRRP
ncbi:MAG: N-acetyltransferase [Acidimicrobiia bacterium]|nr:N-acetyltransferase [Acidimicrobiia bacterium]